MSRAAAAFAAFIALSVSALPSPAQAPAKPLSVEAIYAHGMMTGQPPSELTWSPDGKHLTYLDGGQLMDVDSATGKAHVLVSAAKMAPLDGKSISDQDRDHRSRYNLASYLWSPDSMHLLFDSDGRLWLYNLQNGTGVLIGTTGASSGDDPKFSPDGSTVSFIRNHGLHAIRLSDFKTPTYPVAPISKADDGSGVNLFNGEVDWVYEEELDVHSNYFWSPDSKHIAYLQMDETRVPRYPITDWIPTHALVASQRYPQPGDPNPDVRIGIAGARGGKTTWINLPFHAGDDYIPRFGWVDGNTVWVEVLTRDHKHRTLFFASIESGQSRQMVEIADDKFLDESYDVLTGGGSIVLANWSDGHNHLYLYGYDEKNPLSSPAKLVRQLTAGDFDVNDLYRLDAARKLVTYTSNESNPHEQQVWQVNFSGERKPLTAGAGFHEAVFSPDGATFADTFSARMDPPTEQICHTADAAGSCRVVWQTHALDAYKLRAPVELSTRAHDGTTLYSTLLLPEGKTSAASVPLIVNPYGGPHEQQTANHWKYSLLFDELLAQRGFAVLHTDNRGMGSRGRDFAQAAYHNFGPVQFQDQLTALDAALAKYPQLDGKRLGWWGWSWGGTFTLYALTHSDRFQAGVAVAPVTDWRNYDSVYTERYMGLPAENAQAYRDFSVVNSAANLKGRLLIAHGTGDDNVHLENTVQFIQKLIEAGIPYDLQIYPRKTHSIEGPDVRTHLYNRILSHFEKNLMPASPSAPGN